ncbi:transcriptional repressor TraM [Pararhizobium sp. YC-54]|uniref:transcriptional repressor TraM n=1 Tax=Pararhizobium sp. YC-54 TaxID=2986920 RepID=UPI0021F71439|nr:transcriptional repressor TraM [Pararhizobium sp. YC-54]MCV9999500.1 transcriptional repressor TraM [Pararhizobium sp. YC-54]
MDPKDLPSMEKLELRPVFGLTHGLPAADLETLTVDAILKHRHLVERADALYQSLPEDYQTGRATGGAQHLEFIEASIDMHAQMSALNTLLAILGYIPKVSVN